jgi:hypothetical protein
MKEISEYTLKECLEEVEMLHGGYGFRDPEKLADRIHELTRWIPVSDKEIEQVADDEKQKDWNDLKYQDVYRDGFIDGAHWMQARIQPITPPEGV